MTDTQRAAAVVAVANWRVAGSNQHERGLALVRDLPAQTNKEMADEAKVSPRTIDSAKVAHQAGLGQKWSYPGTSPQSVEKW
jgi:hypothetical protein